MEEFESVVKPILEKYKPEKSEEEKVEEESEEEEVPEEPVGFGTSVEEEPEEINMEDIEGETEEDLEEWTQE